MVGVEYHGDTVRGGDCANVVSGGDGTSYRPLLVTVRKTFTPEKGGASLRGLKNDRSFNVASTLESRNNRGRRGNIKSWDSEIVFPGILENFSSLIPAKDASLLIGMQ